MGAACIIQLSAAAGARPRITSAYRPRTYQAHLRDVWDKWQLLKSDTTETCKERRTQVEIEWNKHALVRQPVVDSNHTRGTAVDIAGVPDASADAFAAQCAMRRPEPGNDRVHFQLR